MRVLNGWHMGSKRPLGDARISLRELAKLAGDDDLVLAGLVDGDLLEIDHEPSREAILDGVVVTREVAGRFIVRKWPAYITEHPLAVWAFGPTQDPAARASWFARASEQGDPAEVFNPAIGTWFNYLKAAGDPPAEDRISLRRFAKLVGREATAIEGIRSGLLIDLTDPGNRAALLDGVSVCRLTVRCWLLRLFPALDAGTDLRKWADAGADAPFESASIALFNGG